MRYAIYYVPAENSLMADLGARWLGRDLFTGRVLDQPSIAAIGPERMSTLTRDPRRYGFHATLKPPMSPVEGVSANTLMDRFREFAQSFTPVEMSGLDVRRLGSFLALMPVTPVPAINVLAAAAVEWFDGFRAPPDDREMARRRATPLSERQHDMQARWGYPYVFEEYRFHITLSGWLDDEDEAESLSAAARAFFRPVLGKSFLVESIALCVEPAPTEPFQIANMRRLGRT